MFNFSHFVQLWADEASRAVQSGSENEKIRLMNKLQQLYRDLFTQQQTSSSASVSSVISNQAGGFAGESYVGDGLELGEFRRQFKEKVLRREKKRIRNS